MAWEHARDADRQLKTIHDVAKVAQNLQADVGRVLRDSQSGSSRNRGRGGWKSGLIG